MQPKEALALTLRIIGVLGIIYVIRNLMRTFGQGEIPATLHLTIRVIYLLVGLYLVRGAPGLICFAFPEKCTCAGDKPPAKV